MRFAYADPPYPGFAWKLYRQKEVDHAALVEKLRGYDGWALSTSARSLRDVLPLCPHVARVCAWVKPIGVSSKTYGLHNTWEPVVVVPGRRLRPGSRDWLSAQPARNGGDLIGRKPIAFCAWLFDLLGMLPGDSLDDLFPGTGIVSTCWDVVNRGDRPSEAAPDDASLVDEATPEHICRICGCADGVLCDKHNGNMFTIWVEPDLCSACTIEGGGPTYNRPVARVLDDEPS